MSIKAGTADVKKIYAGSTPVKAVYAGDTKVWPSGNPMPPASIHSKSMLIAKETVYPQPPLLNGNTQEFRFSNNSFTCEPNDLHVNATFYVNSLNQVAKNLYTSDELVVLPTLENTMYGAKQYRGAYRWVLEEHIAPAGTEGVRRYYMQVPSVDGFWATNLISWGLMFPADKLPWGPGQTTTSIGINWSPDGYGGLGINGGVPNSWAIWIAIAMSSRGGLCNIKNAVYKTARQTSPDSINSPYDCMIGYGYVQLDADGKASLRAEDYIEYQNAGGAMMAVWEKA